MPSIPKSQIKPTWIAPAKKQGKKSWGYDTNFYRRKAWRTIRRIKLMEDPLCVECEKEGKLVSATVVDHIKARRDAPELELEFSNLQSLCESCHNSKSGREGRGGSNPKNRDSTNRCG